MTAVAERKTKSVGKALRAVPSATARSRIRREFRRRARLNNMRPLNDFLREHLADAIFMVENEWEHRWGDTEAVQAMRTARQTLYRDLRWDEA